MLTVEILFIRVYYKQRNIGGPFPSKLYNPVVSTIPVRGCQHRRRARYKVDRYYFIFIIFIIYIRVISVRARGMISLANRTENRRRSRRTLPSAGPLAGKIPFAYRGVVSERRIFVKHRRGFRYPGIDGFDGNHLY